VDRIPKPKIENKSLASQAKLKILYMSRVFLPYWERTKEALPVLLMVSFAAALVAYVVVSNLNPTHHVHFSYLVSLSVRDQTEDFRFDGFYALQATDLFAVTLARWVQTPETIVAAFAQVGLPTPTEDPRQLVRLIRAEKTAPQLVQVTVEGDSSDEAQELASGLQQVMEQNVQQYHDQGIPALQFRVVTTEPWASVSKVSVAVITGATFVFVFFIAVNILLLAESMGSIVS
jgi:capsular polysaccharide biosynthesis protein